MNIKRFIVALLLVFAISGVVQAATLGSGGDGSRYTMLQNRGVFFNNSGGALASGQVVILDLTGSGVVAGTTLGAYVTTTSTADASGVVGVVLDTVGYSSADQTPVIIITRGPADVQALDASDPTVRGEFVGTSTTVGRIGKWAAAGVGQNGGILGKALEDGDGTDDGHIFIWINPSN